jgi:hypothetical protein
MPLIAARTESTPQRSTPRHPHPNPAAPSPTPRGPAPCMPPSKFLDLSGNTVTPQSRCRSQNTLPPPPKPKHPTPRHPNPIVGPINARPLPPLAVPGPLRQRRHRPGLRGDRRAPGRPRQRLCPLAGGVPRAGRGGGVNRGGAKGQRGPVSAGPQQHAGAGVGRGSNPRLKGLRSRV